ncbi:MAG: Uma2 family endonuclease [Solirubrobacteraceae bacterium]
MVTAQRLTAQEYLATPDETVRSELVEGEVIVHGPNSTHQLVLGQLMFALEVWTRAAPGRGQVSLPLDVLIDERNVFAPDLLWYAEGRAPVRGDDGPYPIPGIAVEARSPSTWRYDIGAKKAAYERNRLAELWLIDTDGVAIFAFRRSTPGSSTFDVALELGAQDTLTSPLLPGFELGVGTLIEG